MTSGVTTSPIPPCIRSHTPSPVSYTNQAETTIKITSNQAKPKTSGADETRWDACSRTLPGIAVKSNSGYCEIHQGLR